VEEAGASVSQALQHREHRHKSQHGGACSTCSPMHAILHRAPCIVNCAAARMYSGSTSMFFTISQPP